MKIVYEGFYGFKNTGDDAFIEVSTWGAEKYWECRNNVFLGASLPDTIYTINKKQVLPSVKGFDRINLLSHLVNTNYFISSGGSTLSELPWHSNKMLAKQFKKIKPGLKLGAIGVSVGPFKNSDDEKDIIGYLQSLDFLSVRDYRSYQYASSLDLPYNPVNAFDLAALLPQVYNQPKKVISTAKKPTIGISICNYESYIGGNVSKESKRNSFFKELIGLLNKQDNVLFKAFIINGNKKIGDLQITNKLTNGIPNDRLSVIAYNKNTKMIWDEIRSCDLMISTRLHASIFSCYANVPFFLIEYHKKCSDFLEDVGQHKGYRIYDAEVSPSEVLQKINSILDGNYFEPKYIDKTIALSEKNFTSHSIV